LHSFISTSKRFFSTINKREQAIKKFEGKYNSRFSVLENPSSTQVFIDNFNEDKQEYDMYIEVVKNEDIIYPYNKFIYFLYPREELLNKKPMTRRSMTKFI